jgi:antigen 43
MTTTITPPNRLNFYQLDASNVYAVNDGILGSTSILTNEYSLFIIGNNDTVTNSGEILNGGGGGQAGVGIRATVATVINQLGGIIQDAGTDGAGIYDQYGAPSIVNFGSVISGGGYGAAILLEKGGFVSNASTGSLIGSGVFVSNDAGTVINAGHIFGDTYGGIDLTAGGMVTNLSGGIITATGATYGVQITAGSGGTVENAGTISGGTYAVRLQGSGAANRVIIDSAGIFVGTVSGGSGNAATLEFGASPTQTTFSGAIGTGQQFTNFGTIAFENSSKWLVKETAAVWASETIAGLGTLNSGDTIDVTGFTAVNTGTLTGGTSLTLTNAGGTHEVLSFATGVGSFTVTTGGGITGTDINGICFCPGTMIRTPNGDVKVEHLAVGDTVATVGNNTQTITWIGKGNVLATKGKRGPATPIIVRKGALDDNVPNQDLHVTKGHSLYLDGVLIPVEFLVNHKSILWDDAAQEVEIYHVELATHDVLIANGAPAESYRDDGNRWLFQNANDGWDEPEKMHYAPVLTGGPVVDEIWERLLDRTGPRDLPLLTDDPDLHLIIDGTRVDALESHDSIYVFRLPFSQRA